MCDVTAGERHAVIITKLWMATITKFESNSNCFMWYVYLHEICKLVTLDENNSKCN